ncbi:MAG: sensor histidine kinase [Proteobacteria bacterium]|nr:sensor histidine kinase [Pseudomonadota bacterium]
MSRYAADLGRLISRTKAENALRAAAIESALASRAKSAFLATMTHELRTPLNAIIGFSELLVQADKVAISKEQSIDYAGHIARAGHNLLGIVSDVLDVSRIESGALKLDRRLADIVDVIDGAVEIARPGIEQKKQVLEVKIAPGLANPEIDTSRIRKAIVNLLSNANKFTPDGGRIVLVATTENSRDLTIAIADTGIGMTEEQIAQALKPFAQVQSEYSRQHEGTGLGLTITKSLIELHGGRMVISSTPGVGTMVAFTLPLAAGQSGHRNQPKSFLFRKAS